MIYNYTGCVLVEVCKVLPVLHQSYDSLFISLAFVANPRRFLAMRYSPESIIVLQYNSSLNPA